MYNLDSLALVVAEALNITDKAARDSMEAHIDRIARETGETVNPDEISDYNAGRLMEFCLEAQRTGDLGSLQLTALADAARAYDQAHSAFQVAEQQRMAAVRAALAAGARVVDICRITGMARSRVYQIKDA